MSLSSFELRLVEWLRRKTSASGMRRTPALSAAVATDIGLVRDENQDRVAIARGSDAVGREYVVLALADGIGGLSRGAECASLALASFFASIHFDSRSVDDPKAWLHKAAMRANSRVHREMRGTGGSTLVAAIVTAERRVHWLSVGDSRVHVARRADLTQVSVDDTIAGQLGRPLDSDLDKSNLLQFIGIGPQLEPHVEEILVPGPGAIVLTSDGVHFLDPKWMGLLIARAPDVGQAARRLVENARWCGGPDNASVALIAFSDQLAIPMAGAPSSVLEIWDPFGDLALMGFPGADEGSLNSGRIREPFPRRDAERMPNNNPRIAETPAAVIDRAAKSDHVPAQITAPKVPAKKSAKSASPKRQPTKAKTRRPGGTKKAKPVLPPDDDASGDDEAPVFVIEFPNKAS